jgi:hypothetical protein
MLTEEEAKAAIIRHIRAGGGDIWPSRMLDITEEEAIEAIRRTRGKQLTLVCQGWMSNHRVRGYGLAFTAGSTNYVAWRDYYLKPPLRTLNIQGSLGKLKAHGWVPISDLELLANVATEP